MSDGLLWVGLGVLGVMCYSMCGLAAGLLYTQWEFNWQLWFLVGGIVVMCYGLFAITAVLMSIKWELRELTK